MARRRHHSERGLYSWRKRDILALTTRICSGGMLNRAQWRADAQGDAHSFVKIARFLSARVIKLTGNLIKGLCYCFYILAPQKRFLIPHRAPPLLSRPSKHLIPKIIWQTNFTDKVTIAVYLNYLFNRILSPTYEYRLMDDAEQAEFIQANYPAEIFDAYSKLQIGAARADLWRVLVLNKFGGVYLDMDAHVVWPLGYMIKPHYKELYMRHRDQMRTNYFIASAKQNPHLDLVIAAILENIADGKDGDVFTVTGPLVLHRALEALDLPTAYYQHSCYQGTFTNEFFQYVDHPQGKWVRAQEHIPVVKR